MLPVRATPCTMVLPLLLLLVGHGVSAAKDRVFGDTININDSWELIPAEDTAVESLADLKDGVYLLELSTKRTDCGPVVSSASGTGRIFSEIYTLFVHIAFHTSMA